MRLAILFVLLAISTSFAGLPGVIIWDVPDANQMPPATKPGWCAPLSAVNVIDYWANVRCRAGAYMLLGPNPPEVAAEDIGWFCGTNGYGNAPSGPTSSPDRMNQPPTRWPGTLTTDIQPGIEEFIQWDIYHPFNNPNPVLPGKTSAEWLLDTESAIGFDHFRDEIDAGRPAVLCFSNWDIVYKTTITDPSLQEPVHVYIWADPVHDVPQLDDAPEEQWYPDDGDPNTPGHAVTGYGYWENYDPLNSGTPANWAIVRDNWLCTPKAVAVPWEHWNATVTMDAGEYIQNIPFTTNPYYLNGSVTLFEKFNSLSFQLRNSSAMIYVRATDQQTLYWSISNTKSSISQVFEYRLCFDALNNGAMAPQPDDVQIVLKTDGAKSEYQGNGVHWSAIAQTGWDAAFSVPPLTGQFSIELEIDYARLGLYRGFCDTLGFSIWEREADTFGWPSASSDDVPCAWGKMVSTDCYTPIELSSFNVTVLGHDVLLTWSTESESNNLGFDILRADPEAPFVNIGFVSGVGTTTTPQTYCWRDVNLQPGEYTYQLKQIDTNGTEHFYGPELVSISPPESFAVSQAYPNPFNNSTRFRIDLPERMYITIDIFAINGHIVRHLAKEAYETGYHTISWDGRDDHGKELPTGLYFCRIYGETINRSLKLLLVK
ncbi:hypothetical protein JXA70_19115 [candidate division KSB1 bacterium]|nr:hypothetical protein [candidate division KSB1 bacterium]